MTILSLSLLAAIKVASEISVSAIHLQDKTYAQWVALNKIAEVRLQTGWPAVGKSDGDTDMAGRSWHWVMEIKNTDDKDVHKLEVSVNPTSDKDNPAATAFVTAFVGRPL
jgi:general secretion pathway protein I